MKDGIGSEQGLFDPVHIKNVAITSSGITLTAGIVAWALRSGALVTSLMSTMPLWRSFDPLPILAYKNRKAKKKNDVAQQDSNAAKGESIISTKPGLLGNNTKNIESLFGTGK
jgi:hypothetical protein